MNHHLVIFDALIQRQRGFRAISKITIGHLCKPFPDELLDFQLLRKY